AFPDLRLTFPGVRLPAHRLAPFPVAAAVTIPAPRARLAALLPFRTLLAVLLRAASRHPGTRSPSAASRPATPSATAPAPAMVRTAGLLPADDLLEMEKRVPRGFLLRFLLVAPVPAAQDLGVHDHLDREDLLVVGAELARDPVLRVGLELAL